MHFGYFEGIVQLRNATDEVIYFIRDLARSKREDMISKEKPVGSGVDFYVKKKSFLRYAASQVQAKYGGEVIFSDRLRGVDKMTSKLLYRETVLITIPDLLKGDIVSFKDDVFLIHSVNKTKVNLTSLSGKGRVIVDYTKTRLDKVSDVHKTTVTKTHPRLEVLHPLTYDSVPVINPGKRVLGENVKVVIFDEKVYLV